jgi:formate hydrogenlyase subunit 3/multisubunit Na+/H+ antiporter MnhD subunit
MWKGAAMSGNELFLASAGLWCAAATVAVFLRLGGLARALLSLGCIASVFGAGVVLLGGTAAGHLPFGIAGLGSDFVLKPAAAWLLFFGSLAATFATALATPSVEGRPVWCLGAAMGLLGALGVFGLQDGISFLVAWELMSLGGAVMILGEVLEADRGRPVLFMLALLETGAVALILAFLILTSAAGSFTFAGFAQAGAALPQYLQFIVGLLLLIGFGAKIGLLPFYEWFPETYGSASGASGALLSGGILNAAFFALARGLTEWLPLTSGGWLSLFDGIVVVVAVASCILTVLYAFQQEDWRGLLSFSSAENGAIAVALLGASLVFARDGLMELAGLAWIVALLHLAGHALAKSAMFLAADGVFHASQSYTLAQSGLFRKSSIAFGVGVLFAGMSLAALPPQAGFVSEWYMFQTVFQGFHLSGLGDRLLLVIAGAGLALTVAVALATFVKVLGIGLLGRGRTVTTALPWAHGTSVFVLGCAVLFLAVGMPWWLSSLQHAEPARMVADAASKMRDDWLLVPLTAKFAFISPSKLVIMMPLLSLIPLGLLALSWRGTIRKVPVWYGGREHKPVHVATTALAFSNALRTFYSFIYRPTVETTRVHSEGGNGHPYFIQRLIFSHDVAPLFGPMLFKPIETAVISVAVRLRALQSGHLNFYLALIGLLLVGVLVIALL